jgi:diguanylate cyclase (GGDEF)-like protein
MSLRARLALLVVAATVVPLLIAATVLRVQTGRDLRARAESELAAVREGAAGMVEVRRRRASDLASDLIAHENPRLDELLASRDETAALATLRTALGEPGRERADAVVLADPDGTVQAAVTSAWVFNRGGAGLRLDPDELAAAAREQRALPGTLLEVREIWTTAPGAPVERTAGYVVVALWTDQGLLARLPVDRARGGAALVSGDLVLASVPSGAELPEGAVAVADEATMATWRDRQVLVTKADIVPGLQSASLVLWTPVDAQATPLGWMVVGVLVLLALLAAWWLAGRVVAPIQRAAAAARDMAEGDLRQRVPPAGGPELVDLAAAINTMGEQIEARVDQLERSRDELRRSLSRLGQTLSSSLDLGRTLAVVVETAMDTLSADRAVLMLLTPERDALYAKVGRGLGAGVPRLRVGEGRLGWVASTGRALRLPHDLDEAPVPARGEPGGAGQLLVPLLGRGQVIGVLSLLRDDVDRPFDQDDLDTMTSFAAQATVALENVMLHREAQRLAVTDPLTGLWNFRYFQIQADRELESAARFERPLSLVIIDIDHFKSVNDRQGHQVGDEVLVEVARRIRDMTRVPDVVARYGGEEFVVLLPGTNASGALATAERIRDAVGGAPVPFGDPAPTDRPGYLPVTCSAGVSTFPVHGQTLAGLLRTADAAMYVAKARGRNRVVTAGAVPAAVPWSSVPGSVND